MGPQQHDAISKKACTRCSSQKRRCDRALPTCSLCARRRLICRYDSNVSPSSAPTLSPNPRPEIPPNSDVFTPLNIKTAIIRRLSGVSPKDVASTYSRTIKPWFPFISEPKLCDHLSSNWHDLTLDLVVLCLAIDLFSTPPPLGPKEERVGSDFMSLYMLAKGWIISIEGLGINSLEVVQSRLLITLFEVAHGLYPAAYISIGATVRAAEALAVYSGADVALSLSIAKDMDKEESMKTWIGILVLDRYIAIENGKWPPVTRGRTFPDLLLYVRSQASTSTSSLCPPLSRLFEASNLLDKAHIALNEPTASYSFNMEEVILVVKTLSSFETLLHQEIPEKSKLYGSDLTICTIGLLLSFDSGSKVQCIDEDMRNCHNLAQRSLDSLVEVIVKMIEPFSDGEDIMDVRILPPFVIYLVYKVAAIVTERVWIDGGSRRIFQRLKSLRDALQLISQRWLAGERYLNLLNEDTTPRIWKALEEVGR